MRDVNDTNDMHSSNEMNDTQNDYDNIVDAVNARTNEHNKKRAQVSKVTVIDYITLVLLSILFLFFLCGFLSFFFLGLSDHIEGNEYSAGWHWAWCVMSSPSLLFFGIPSFIVGRRIIKYRKFLKNPTEAENKEQEPFNIENDTGATTNQNEESKIIDRNEELIINGHIETDDLTNMRIIKCNNALYQKSTTSKTIEWIALIILSVLFVSMLGCVVLGVQAGINYHNAGKMDIGTVIAIACIYGIPVLLVLGLPLFFLSRSMIKYHKRMNNIYSYESVKNVADWCVDENRIWATVKDIDYIDYKYAKDVFWVVCDIVKEEEQAIYRYASYKVKEDLFGKIEPGQEIAIYFNPRKPKEYFVNIDEVR